MKSMSWIAGAIIVAAAQNASAGAVNFCGDLENAYGPFDYRTRAEHAENFALVERGHFPAVVENGIRGHSGTIGADLDYTLRAIPNHHRALTSLSRVAQQQKAVQLPGANWPVECYFERAMRFVPNDGSVRAIYASYLSSLGKTDKAFAMFKEAVELEPENPVINYNLGLAYFNRKNYDRSLTYAKKAYALGFPLPGLKNKLAAAGKWDNKPAD